MHFCCRYFFHFVTVVIRTSEQVVKHQKRREIETETERLKQQQQQQQIIGKRKSERKIQLSATQWARTLHCSGCSYCWCCPFSMRRTTFFAIILSSWSTMASCRSTRSYWYRPSSCAPAMCATYCEYKSNIHMYVSMILHSTYYIYKTEILPSELSWIICIDPVSSYLIFARTYSLRSLHWEIDRLSLWFSTFYLLPYTYSIPYTIVVVVGQHKSVHG